MPFDFNLYEDYYHATMIADKTWMISSRCEATPAGSDSFLLEGDEYAICIDAGMSKE